MQYFSTSHALGTMYRKLDLNAEAKVAYHAISAANHSDNNINRPVLVFSLVTWSIAADTLPNKLTQLAVI